MGWNTKDALAAMKPQYAVTLDNYFPEAGRVRLRRGYNTFATGLGGPVETLIAHSSGTVNRLIGAADGKLWDVEATPTRLGTTDYTSDRWQGAAFNGYTLLVNGVDDPARIEPDGSLSAGHGLTGTGLTPSTLIQVMPFKRRLFFVEKDTATIWYGPPASIQGELQEFNLSLVVPEGGNIVAIGTLTLDSGFGVDDLFCAFYESGAVSVYQGTNIDDPNRFGEVGVFMIGALVGRRSLLKLGGDLIAITTDGYVPVRSLLETGRVGKQLALSDAISSAVTEAAGNYKANFGWQGVLHTPASWLMFNVPPGHQHVMNTQTGAWCRFTGMPAQCWARYKDRLFWGSADGNVHEANVGRSDGGGDITGEVQSAFNYFGSKQSKKYHEAQSLIGATSQINYSIGFATDFQPTTTIETTGSVGEEGVSWDDLTWDNFKWTGREQLRGGWRGVDRFGTTISVRFFTQTRGVRVSLYATNVQYRTVPGIAI